MSRKKASVQEPPAALKSTSDRKRERLARSVLKELWSIWRANPRVPSIASRRSWAISRNASPRLVGGWFLRRKADAKKAGHPIQDESYDLALDPPITPKREQSATPIEHDLDAFPDLPSDDTLVYPPDMDDPNDMEASSDTVFDEDALTEIKRIAYTQHQPEPSSVDCYAAAEPYEEASSLLVCNQGRGNQSNFTCILCSADPSQDEVLMPDSRGNVFTPCLRLDYSPDTLSELSAIPCLFRTPRTVAAENVINWTIIEDELGRLVNDGELDFSFLDVPDLASMELPD